MKKSNLILIVFLFYFSACRNKNTEAVLRYDSGSLRYEWIRDQKVDSIIEYYENGQRSSIVTFYNLSKTDTPFILTDGDIRIKYELLTGNIFYFYPNGVLMKKLSIQNGLMDKNQYQYYQNGNLEVRTEYKLGRIEGVQYEYYDNGRVKRYGMYIGDTCVGGFTHFDTLGRKLKYIFTDSSGATIYMIRYDTLGKVVSEEGDSILENLSK
jgi:antitoxin component YwqK of YwqJK toxin-antitoxin module